MAATSVITCPKCTKRFKGRDELVGRKVRCPSCSHSFIVQKLTKDKGDSEDDEAKAAREAVAALSAKKKAGGKGAPSAPPPEPAATPSSNQAMDDMFDEDGNPYGVTTLDLSPRCPNCANELTSADALICLHCGYNTQTRKSAQTKKTIEHTAGERLMWLLPGLICALVVFLLYVGQMFYCFLLPDMVNPDSWVSFLNHESMRLWIGLILLGLMWGFGLFAQKRLLFNPRPPEKVMD